MSRLIAVALAAGAALCAPALAQQVNPRPGSNPAVNTQPQAERSQTGQLEPGANSFTEGQARSRLEQAGYQNVSELIKQENGIWRARAMHQGRQVTVGLDYRGNIALQ
jgi:hypothetical protein